ncbi:hypothetical protein SLA2020_304480 [Shorea laevis]
MTTHKRWPLAALRRAVARSFSSSSTASTTTDAASATFPLKNVTRSNFDSVLSELRSHVRAADFVAIDLEMTGITSAPWRESFEFDRFDIRYLKVRDSADKFAVLQFGVCPFRWEPLKQSFIAHPHNFFVFPRQEIPLGGQSYEFLCQTSSMDFLAKYQFDFNACINEGISFLSRRQEEEALRRLKHGLMDSWQDSSECTDIPLVRVADVLFTERMKKKLSEWRDGLLQNRDGGLQYQSHSNESKQQLQTVFFEMRPALSLTGFTSHQLKLIKMVTKKHFKDLSYVHKSNEISSQELVVYTDSESDKDLLMKMMKDGHYKQAQRNIKDAVGFRHVVDLLSSESKLIVGHNCFLDIAHISRKFLGPLPPTAEEFVSSINKYLPHIIDTKILLNADNILQQQMKRARTTLSSAFSILCPEIAHGSKSSMLPHQPCVKVEVQVDDLRSSNWNSGAKHEAGYDAFMTGCIFAQACSHLGVEFSPSRNLAQNEKLQKHINLLYLTWTNGVIIDLRTGNRITESLGANLKKKFPPILFENIILIWGFPSKLKAREIRECISKVFGPRSVTTIYHIDPTAVFVQFSKPELVSDFLTLKEVLEKNNDLITELHPLSKLLEGGNTGAASYEAYKEICSSPIAKILFADQAEAVGIKWKTKLVVPQIEVETQEHASSGPESTAKTESDVAGESETAEEVRDSEENNPPCGRFMNGEKNNPPYRRFMSDKNIDSLFADEVKHIRTVKY